MFGSIFLEFLEDFNLIAAPLQYCCFLVHKTFNCKSVSVGVNLSFILLLCCCRMAVDFFSSNFNAEKVLSDLRLPLIECESFESVDEFEQHLWNTNAALVAQLQELEVRENVEKKSLTGLSR